MGFDSFKRGVNVRPEFNHLDLYKFLEIEAVTKPTGRVYKTPVGDLMSATTMLSKTADEEKLKGLERWRERVGYDWAEKETTRCAERGTLLHDMSERYLRNQDLGDTHSLDGKWFQEVKSQLDTMHNIQETVNLANAMFVSLKKKLNHITDIVGLEEALYSKRMGIAGRVDGVGLYKGMKCIIDFKTSNKPKKKSYIVDYGIQTCAYSYMLQDLTGLCYPNMAILIAVEEGLSTQEFIFHRDDYSDLLLEKLKAVR